MCIVSCTDSLWLQNENFPVQDENVLNEIGVSCDEEQTVKVRSFQRFTFCSSLTLTVCVTCNNMTAEVRTSDSNGNIRAAGISNFQI
jgi:hypothetical protein